MARFHRVHGFRLSSYVGTIRLLPRWDIAPEDLPRVLDRIQTASAINAATTSHANAGVLEALHRAVNRFHTIGLASPPEAALRDVLAAVTSGALVGVEEPEMKPVHVYRPEPEVWEPAPPPAPVKVTASLEVKFVYDQADKGVGGLEFKVRTPDGKEQKLKTDGNGMLKLRNIDPGYVELWTEVDDAELETTVTVRAEGDVPTTEFAEDYETKKAAKRLLRVDALRVHEGEGFKSLAEECDVTWETLAQFNFGTKDEKKVTEALEDEVGCLGVESLDAVKFSEYDNPGVLFVAKPWKASFHTSQTPVIRLAGILRPKPIFVLSV